MTTFPECGTETGAGNFTLRPCSPDTTPPSTPSTRPHNSAHATMLQCHPPPEHTQSIGSSSLSVAPLSTPISQSLPMHRSQNPSRFPNTEREMSASLSPSPFATPITTSPCDVPNISVALEPAARKTAARRGVRPSSTLPPRAPISKRSKSNGTLQKELTGKRGSGFSQGELDNLLELLEVHLPLGKDEWESVARLQESRYPAQRRTTDSLRRKFAALCRNTVLTGDPNIPQEVLKAKHIREQMTERADIGDGAESDDDYTENISDKTPSFPQSALNGSTGATVIQETGKDSPSASNVDNADHSVIPSPRPLVQKRSVMNSMKGKESDSILEVIQASIMQENMRRDAEHHQRMMDREDEKTRREEDRRVREEQRAEDRERREDERRRSDNMMQLMMVALLGKQVPDIGKPSEEGNN